MKKMYKIGFKYFMLENSIGHFEFFFYENSMSDISLNFHNKNEFGYFYS